MADEAGTAAIADALLDGGESSDGERSLRAVEVGIGERTAVATALVERGVSVLATDVVARSVPDPLAFRRDDLLDPEIGLYSDAGLLYALRLPPELHRAFAELAGEIGARGAFTTLGGDPPSVEAAPEQLAGSETLFWLSE